jgi:hypothetical protein
MSRGKPKKSSDGHTDDQLPMRGGWNSQIVVKRILNDMNELVDDELKHPI